jgi:hypothetical protein
MNSINQLIRNHYSEASIEVLVDYVEALRDCLLDTEYFPRDSSSHFRIVKKIAIMRCVLRSRTSDAALREL